MNPFVNQELFHLKVVKIIENNEFNYTNEGSITEFKETRTKTYYAEGQENTSVYNISYVDNVLFKSIGAAGRDILLYIIYHLKKDIDFINLSYSRISTAISISHTTIRKGLQDLSDNAIIAKKSQSEYWINPYFIFKGDRKRYYSINYPESIDIVNTVVR